MKRAPRGRDVAAILGIAVGCLFAALVVFAVGRVLQTALRW